MEKSEIANRIKELREAKKMTQNALANAAGVSPTYIYQLERGEKSPTVEYLDHICWGLKNFLTSRAMKRIILLIFHPSPPPNANF